MKNIILPNNHISLSLASSMRDVCQPMIKNSPINHVGWMRLYLNGDFQFLMCNPEIATHHIKQRYIILPNIDPKLIKENFYYFHVPSIKDNYEQAIYDYKKISNMNHPIFFFEKHKNYYEIFSFTTLDNSPSIFNFYLNNLEMFKNFKLYFREKAKFLIESTSKNSIHIPDDMMAKNLFDPKFFSEAEENKYALSLSTIKKEFYLSRRETEILHPILLGFACKEIAKNLGLSHRTIEQYLNSIKTKMGINSKRSITQYVLKNHYLYKSLCDSLPLPSVKNCFLENDNE